MGPALRPARELGYQISRAHVEKAFSTYRVGWLGQRPRQPPNQPTRKTSTPLSALVFLGKKLAALLLRVKASFRQGESLQAGDVLTVHREIAG
jgi:hypothetical protein